MTAEAADVLRWFVVNSHTREEAKAAWHLRNQQFETYFPQYLRRRRHARKTDWVRRPLFPSYLFVRLNLTVDRWRAVASTIGVYRLISAGNMPAPVPDGVVEALKGREDAKGLVSLERMLPLARGTPVRIDAGPMKDSVGLFDCASDEDRVTVLLNLLGRQVRVKLPLDSISAYA